MRTAQRFIVVCLAFLLLAIIVVPTKALAQSYPLETNADVPQTMHTYTQGLLIEIISALNCQITGIDPLQNDRRCLGVDAQSGKIGFVENGGGAIGLMSSMIVMLYTPPVQTSDFTKYLAQNFGVVKPAYAQAKCAGIGYCGLMPLITLWAAFRNIVYLVFVIVFIIVGFGIMLRVKIDPRTVMSIENQIPKIIIGLLLITFSYAIAGFLVDIMYLSIYLIFNIFSDPNITKALEAGHAAAFTQKITDTQRTFNGENAFGVMNNLVTFTELVSYPAGAVKEIVSTLFSTTAQFTPASSSGPWYQNILNIGAWFSDSLRNAIGAVIGYFVGALAFLVIGIALLVAMFRLWFALLSAYAFFLIDVVTAPFWIIGGVLPESPMSFSAWIKDMVANLSAFPVTIVMFLMARVFMSAFHNSSNQLFVAPLIGNPGSDPQNIGSLVGLAMVLITPSVVNMTREALKAPTFKYAAEAGRSLGSGQDVVGTTFKQGTAIAHTAKHGSYPQPGETGFKAIQRYLVGRLH